MVTAAYSPAIRRMLVMPIARKVIHPRRLRCAVIDIKYL
jgi:hypothetical protein